MKQKLFSIFFSLALLLPLYGQATNQDSAQSDVGTIRLPFDGNHNVYFVSDANEMNKVSFVGENNRRNAPQVAWDFEPTFNPATEMTHNMDDGDVGTLDLWYMQFRRNGNSYPTFYFNLLFERGTTYNYGSVTGPPLGTYTVNNSGSGLNDHNFLGNVSGYQAKYYKDSKNYFTIRYGTITFYKGANGRPYIIAELNSDINGSNSGWLLRAVIGSPLTHSISVTKSPNITATITGTGSFVEGGSTTLTVSNVQSGYHFVRWEDGGNTSTNTSYTINNIQAAHNVTAVFAADNAPQYTITVQANNDAYCTVSGGGTYYAGTNVTISSASKNEHLYIFDMFMLEGEDEDQGEPSFNITVTGDATYTAYYRLANNGTITATASSAIAGTATASPSGSLTGGTAVTLTAVANDGYTFTGWDDDNNGTIDNTDPTRTVYVDGTKTYTAQFVEGVTIDIQAAMTSNHGFGWGYCFYYWAKTYGYDIMIRGADNLVYTENADFGISEINTSESYINDHGTTVRFTAFDARFYSQGGKKVLEANAVGNNGKNYHLILRGHSESYSNEQTEAYSQTYGSYAPEHDSENIYYFTTQNGSGDYYSVTWKSQIVFITDESLCGTIPSGIYQASDTWDDGTLLSDGYTYGNYKLNSSSFVYMPATGYAEVVNRDETYYVLVDGYNSAGYSFYQTIGTTPYSVTVSSNSNSYGSAGIVWHSNNCGDVVYGAGTQKFFSGNSITLTATPNSGYEFWRWSDEDASVKTSAYGASRNVTVSGNLTLQAIFRVAVTKYIVTINTPEHGTLTVMDGETLVNSGDNVDEGTVLTVTTTPAADYHFGAWTNDGAASVTVNGAKTIGATFAQNDYFLNATYGAGGASVTRDDSGNSSTVKRAGNTVTLTPTAATGYNFLAWAGADAAKMSGNVFTFPTNGTHNTTYNVQATFQAVTYNLTYEGLNGATHSNPATYTVETATITLTAPSARTGYTFTGWTCGGDAITQIVLGSTGDKTITANWTANNHTLTWNANGGSLEGGTAAGTTAYGTALTAPTATRTGYTFNGWDPSVPANMPDADATYTAQWNIVTYNLTYEGLNGATNSNPATYTVESETITLADPGARDGYAFTGWTINGTPVTEIPHGSTGDKTLTANWNAKLSAITLEDNRENSFYNTFKSTYNGAEGVIVTYERQFTAGRWSTLCLPFDVNKNMFSSLNFGSRIYEFKYATGNANDNSGVNLYFSIAKSIQAGKGYIVNADATLAARTSFVFPGVTINLSADKGDTLGSVTAYNALDGSGATQGNIELVGTLRKGTLVVKEGEEENTYMGLKGNKIYYPNITTGSTILAYRGIFRSIDRKPLNAERIRIVVDGEEKAELEIINGELQDVQETKKFIENGVLYIERNGIIYDATGRKVE